MPKIISFLRAKAYLGSQLFWRDPDPAAFWPTVKNHMAVVYGKTVCLMFQVQKRRV